MNLPGQAEVETWHAKRLAAWTAVDDAVAISNSGLCPNA